MTNQLAKRPLEMKINLNALEHLGMNLYSKIPAVLSEIVANAWDADASRVSVTLSNGKISIEDDGIGMTRDEVIDQFLNVGFQRRPAMGAQTLAGRKPMGRKGIGKLSSFSIANVVTVYTARNDEQTAFRMNAKKIRKQMQRDDGNSYHPKEISHTLEKKRSGTCIILTGLKRRANVQTAKGLRKRIARRFSVVGPQHGFAVSVNGEEVHPTDRGYYEHVEYCWTYGDQKDTIDRFSRLAGNGLPIDRTEEIGKTGKKVGICGWIGTVRRPSLLKDKDGERSGDGERSEDSENLNRIAIFMRGKVAQEDILGDFGLKEIFADYIVGEIHCENLDQDNKEDIATSSRQALKYDDPRFEAVRKMVHGELRHIAGQWTDLRNRDGSKVFCKEVPAVAEWLSHMQGDTRKKAERWIGRLNVLRSGDQAKRELLKASVLAFESYRRKEQLDYLENLSNETLEPNLDVFNDIDDLQLSYYGQIVNLRLGVITALEEKLQVDEKEAVIRDHIYEHLWLLDPSWERAKGSEAVERRITTFLKETSANLSKAEAQARIDIGYRTAQGRHVIIELKRASVSVSVDELMPQIRKYRDGARELIAKSDYPDWPLDIICLVGKPPREWQRDRGRKDVKKILGAVEARLAFYDQLLDHSRRAYADYLEQHKKIDKLWQIFEGIDNFAETPSN